MLLNLIPLLKSSWKYLLIGVIALATLALVVSLELRRADKAGFDRATAACSQQIQQQQLEVQQQTINVTQTAKTIAKTNASRERDDLIDSL